MGSALATLIVFALVLSLVESLIGRDLVGYAFVIAQALVVGVFGELQYMGLRRPVAAAA